MKMRSVVFMAATVLLGWGGAVFAGGASAVISVDEKGIGTGTSTSVAPDFLKGGGITYTLPFRVTSGDVVLYETVPTPNGGTSQLNTDLLRFKGNKLTFYSLLQGTSDGPADIVSLPTPNGGQGNNTFSTLEGGSEGNNGLNYTPIKGSPGYDAKGRVISYVFHSDGNKPIPTPEPASLTLLGLSAVGLFGYGWRRRKLALA